MTVERNYQRKYLRAPYKEPVLYVNDGFVFKGHSLNISEGGVLLDQIPNFPKGDNVPLALSLPQYPYFKNFSLTKLINYSFELFPKKVIKVKCEVVRKSTINSEVDQVFTSRIGAKFTEINDSSRKEVENYVSIFASNLIYLQVLLDSIESDEDNLKKVRVLSQYLGYEKDIKIALLRKQVALDYQSLQWP